MVCFQGLSEEGQLKPLLTEDLAGYVLLNSLRRPRQCDRFDRHGGNGSRRQARQEERHDAILVGALFFVG